MKFLLQEGLYLGRESNPNLIFRRDLFYPLNYQGFHNPGEQSVYKHVPRNFHREDTTIILKHQMLEWHFNCNIIIFSL